MELFVPSDDLRMIIQYKSQENDWDKSIISDAKDASGEFRPTICSQKRYIGGIEDVNTVLLEDGKAYFLDYVTRVFNCQVCGDRFFDGDDFTNFECFDDFYSYYYIRNCFNEPLSRAISCYANVIHYKGSKAKDDLDMIKSYEKCSAGDLYYIEKILNSLIFIEGKKFMNLMDFAEFLITDNGFVDFKKYLGDLEGYSIKDVCSNIKFESRMLTFIRAQLGNLKRNRALIEFMPSLEEKKEEIANALKRQVR